MSDELKEQRDEASNERAATCQLPQVMSRALTL